MASPRSNDMYLLFIQYLFIVYVFIDTILYLSKFLLWIFHIFHLCKLLSQKVIIALWLQISYVYKYEWVNDFPKGSNPSKCLLISKCSVLLLFEDFSPEAFVWRVFFQMLQLECCLIICLSLWCIRSQHMRTHYTF